MRPTALVILAFVFCYSVSTAECQTNPGDSQMVPFIEIPPEIANEATSNTSIKQSGEIEGLRYSGLPPKKVESVALASIEQQYIITGKITENGLRKVLNKIYSDLSGVGGFSRHARVNAILVFLYLSREDADAGYSNWIARLNKSPDGLPEITINKQRLTDVTNKPETKMGLSDSTRRQIWKEYIQAQDQAARDSGGLGQIESIEESKRCAIKFRELENSYKIEVATKHGITP